MFKQKELETLTYHDLEKLAQDLNGGGYSVPISKKKNSLIENIFNAFVVKYDERIDDEGDE